MPSSTDALQAPFSPELLADLHADALPEDVSRRLWPLVRLDEDSLRILAGLDAVSARLHELGEDPTGTLSIPPDVAQQIDRTLHTVEQSTSPVDVVVPLRPRRRRMVLGTAAAAALLTAGSVAVAAAVFTPDEPESIVADPTQAPDSSLVLDSADLDSGFAFGIIGKRDPGALADPADLAACLQSNDVDPATTVLGSSRVRVDGRDGTLLILAGEQPSQFIALAVGNDCSTANPDVLTRRDIG
ncbi:hypothetical protein O4160_20390 [Rhodococcus sp. IEGM 1401]|uniref:hypothetical protein n=1 Tax=unclassified Rhodococcus (in: high G+C Gram-positive bacteria) TaxID=192944 RepID=UPI0011EBA0F9|nr:MULTISPECIES: hypothetical protein [unclassified Rhodococcus (in: high G+C Gram-positive bacteria)]KAA0921668.1 hypothetical protein FQ188_23815 [Rhodococcus sp. ANT_H53B]MCZ4563208.1 hypothetical protein [Rhodococcus sp. IEGM 1401]MDI9923335.1 hypothetical protein [Rhodococcus sp. IEGM 1372]MDV8035823.1 hypothetical protein [Rhodococcus sp. IEGM 1414]MDV8077204.1 hypothetical protein [Rhodococcus sp. IEGM 1370]